MAKLYADEDFRHETVDCLKKMGHDVLTAQDAGQAGLRIPDHALLVFAAKLGRCVLTHNTWHFVKLHERSSAHAGIIACSQDDDYARLADQISDAIAEHEPLVGKIIRVHRPQR